MDNVSVESAEATATVEHGDFPQFKCDPELRAEIKRRRAELSWKLNVFQENGLDLRLLTKKYSKRELAEKFARRSPHKTRAEMTPEDVLRRWPALTAHMICESLGYATPMHAAVIILNAVNNRPDHCEWISCCHKSNPKIPLNLAIKTRHYHKGYMADFKQALYLVCREILGFPNPVFASWF